VNFNLLSDNIVYYAAGNCPISGIHKDKKELLNIEKSPLKKQKTHTRLHYLKFLAMRLNMMPLEN